MCRYSDNHYRTHWVCFKCRWSVKRHDEGSCVHCLQPLVNLGHDVRIPRKWNKNQWRKLEILASRHIMFFSCGCKGPGYRPKTLSEAKTFVRPWQETL